MRRGREPASFDVLKLAHQAVGFSGAELEQAVVSALYDAFAEGTELGQKHLEHALTETVPLSRMMEEEILGLRAWAQDRTRPASSVGGG
jgi:hypothetical protein